VRFGARAAPLSIVMPGLGPRLSGSAMPAGRETPAGIDSIASLSLPGHEITHVAAHSPVMPGLGPGIHEFHGAGHKKAPACRYKCGSSPRSPHGELVDAGAKPWHDDAGRHCLRAEPDSPGLGPGIHEFIASRSRRRTTVARVSPPFLNGNAEQLVD